MKNRFLCSTILILLCAFSIAQNTKASFDSKNGNVVVPLERAQVLANVIEDREVLKKKVLELQLKLDQAQVDIDSLQSKVNSLISEQYDFIVADRLRDQGINLVTDRIDAISDEEISIWKGLSRGVSLTTSINSQIYSFNPDSITTPFSFDARLALSGEHLSFAVIPFGTALRLPSNELIGVSGVKMSVGYRWF